MWDFQISIDDSDLINRLDFGGKTPMNTKNGLVNEGRYCEKIKNLTAVLPRISIAIFGNAFIIKSIDLFERKQ